MLGVLTGTTRRQGGTQGRRFGRGLFSPKQGNKNFYKGTGARSLGKNDSKGRFHLDPTKIPEIMVPDLTNCPLKPYVAYATPKIKVAPFAVPPLDMTQCEVDLPQVLYPKMYAHLRKMKEAAQKKASKGKKAANTSEPAPVDALQIEASTSL